MKNKVIYKVASLVMTLVMILGSTIQKTAALPAATVTTPSIYWGALVNGRAPTSTNLQGVFNDFETRSGKRMSIIHWGESWILSDGSWGEFQTSYFDNVRNHGSIPMINWASQRFGAGINQADFQLRDVYSGTYDAYIQRWATAAKNWGHPFFLYFDPEMNGWWQPWGEGKLSNGTIINGNSAGDYVIAWRHVHDIFTSVGATNVTWVWAPNHMSTSSQYPVLSTLYPGDAYVDWTGLSVYNKYPTWAGLNPLLTGSEGMTWFRNSYNDVRSLAPNKPMMLAQWASIEAGDGGAKKAAWITDALTVQIPINFPKIKAIVWLNWQETPNETYPIESSPAAAAAWVAGIASPLYATNQFSNLNTSPIPPPDLGYSISGNAGAGYITLNYTDGTPKTAVSDASGNYSFTVSNGWSGAVTPSHGCYTFSPGNRSYTNVTSNQTGQNYTATLNTGAGCVNVNVTIGGAVNENLAIPARNQIPAMFPGIHTGPVKVTSSLPVVTSQRAIYGSSFNELTGFPADQLTTDYWFTYYDDVNMNTWLMIGNPDPTDSAHVEVYIGNGSAPYRTYDIPHGQSVLPKFGISGGPLRVKSTNGVKIFTSQRAAYLGSFNELMGFPANQLTTDYWFTYYDDVNMNTWLMIGNPDPTNSAHVEVYLGNSSTPIRTYDLAHGESVLPRLHVTGGPLRVKSTNGVKIFTSQRAAYLGSFNELMGFPANQLATDYWFTYYDDVNMNTWLMIGNPDPTNSAHVEVYLGNSTTPFRTYDIPSGQSVLPKYNVAGGPLRVKSTNGVNIFTSERAAYGNSFNELMGFPADQMTTDYWFTYYDNVNMATWLMIAKP